MMLTSRQQIPSSVSTLHYQSSYCNLFTDSQVDLVIHRPDLKNQTPIPLFTLLRMSATSSNLDWHETNVPALPGEVATSINEDSDLVSLPSKTHEPQWVTQVMQKLAVSVPADMHFKRGYGDDDVSVASDESDDEDLDDDDDFYGNDDDNTIDIANNGKDAMAVAPEVPEIHPHRFRLHGLTLSPGGNVTAMIASLHSTQHPERGGWHTVRSTVYFGTKPRKRGATLPQAQDNEVPEATEKEKETTAEEAIDPALRGPEPQRPVTPPPVAKRKTPIMPAAEPQQSQSRLTTEARLFEWLYGGGDEVPGVTINHPSNLINLNAPEHQFPPKLTNLFALAIARQKCDLCGARILPSAKPQQNHSHQQQPQKDRRSGLSGCENGHFFSVCTTSGLAIQMPGITRNCGACGSRTMRAEILARKTLPTNPKFVEGDKQEKEKDKDGDVEMAEGGGEGEGEGEGEGGGDGDADAIAARALTAEEEMVIKRKNAEKRLRGEIIAMLGDGICGGCGGKFLN